MGGELTSSPTLTNKQFILESLPYYMAMGMSYDEYMYGDCERAKYYRKADEIRQRRKNTEAWWQGYYFYEALSNAVIAVGFPRKGIQPKYPERPHSITQDEKDLENKRKMEQGKAFLTKWAAVVNKDVENGNAGQH